MARSFCITHFNDNRGIDGKKEPHFFINKVNIAKQQYVCEPNCIAMQAFRLNTHEID